MNGSNYYKVFEQLKELSNIIKENFQILQLEESKEELYKYNKMVGKYCGNNYWTIPMTLSSNECQELYKMYENDSGRKKLDELFINHLLKNKSQNLKIEKNNFLNKSTLVKYHKSYRQAFKAYNKKMYLSSVMILIALFEGICAEYIFEKKRNTDTKNCVNQYLNKKYTDRTKFLTCQDKEAMKSFINNVFHTGVNFENEDSIKSFNRQPIMHGRFLDQIGKRENLQMFNAINNLLFLIKI